MHTHKLELADGTLVKIEGGETAVLNAMHEYATQSPTPTTHAGAGREEPLAIPSMNFGAQPNYAGQDPTLRPRPEVAGAPNVLPLPGLSFSKTHTVVGSGPVRNQPEAVGDALPLPPSTV